eukprot:m51a1_g9809 hypothetical protein (348) ;mRNA; f:1831744-1834663
MRFDWSSVPQNQLFSVDGRSSALLFITFESMIAAVQKHVDLKACAPLRRILNDWAQANCLRIGRTFASLICGSNVNASDYNHFFVFHLPDVLAAQLSGLRSHGLVAFSSANLKTNNCLFKKFPRSPQRCTPRVAFVAVPLAVALALLLSQALPPMLLRAQSATAAPAADATASTPATARTVVLLLMWTRMYGRTVPPAVGHCGNGLWWASTSDRAALGAADALVFHARDINASDMPAARDPMQPWVLATVESPASDAVLFDRTSNATRAFNLTSTYEWGSDGWWPYAPTDIASIMAPVVPTRLRRKSAPILWVASNCWASNQRQVFIKRLMKFVKIDSLGDNCGDGR